MLTVLMECRDQEAALAQSLSALVSGAVEGLVRDVVILDHGSSDGSLWVAEAAGCAFLPRWALAEVVGAARGQWLLLMEPGARPQEGWIDVVFGHVAVSEMPARFSLSRRPGEALLARLLRRAPPLECACLLPKKQAAIRAKTAMGLADLARGTRTVRLDARLTPAALR